MVFLCLIFWDVLDHRLFESDALEVISVTFSAASIALIAFTLGTHRAPISLWHQKKDNLPEHLVTYGAYNLIRHPFYSSFLLALLGAFLYAPAPETLATLLFGLIFLNFTAAREEKMLLGSEFGVEYRKYLQGTGRFWPRLRRKST